MFGKPLAYIVKIKEIREIPGADRIELATVMDYTVVVKKNEYKAGDFGLYVEVDSLLKNCRRSLHTHILNFLEIRSSILSL